ncbi:MAG TPA: hypothetical protein VF211_00750 [Burkholderiales bacterium]
MGHAVALRKALAGALLAGAALASPARAEWSVYGELERFRWEEDVSPRVLETGPMLGVGLRWRQDAPAALRFGYEARLYGGAVDYDGASLFGGTPLTGTTDYGGLRQELQALFRPGAGGLELLAGVGLDYWNRQLGADQHEEYRLAYVRLGVAFDRGGAAGWFAAGGVKHPFWTDENAHFPAIGFAPNPHLTPQGRPSLYGELGYRLGRSWSLAGYYEGYRFEESDPVLVTDGASDFAFFQPASTLDSFGLRLRYAF